MRQQVRRPVSKGRMTGTGLPPGGPHGLDPAPGEVMPPAEDAAPVPIVAAVQRARVRHFTPAPFHTRTLSFRLLSRPDMPSHLSKAHLSTAACPWTACLLGCVLGAPRSTLPSMPTSYSCRPLDSMSLRLRFGRASTARNDSPMSSDARTAASPGAAAEPPSPPTPPSACAAARLAAPTLACAPPPALGGSFACAAGTAEWSGARVDAPLAGKARGAPPSASQAAPPSNSSSARSALEG
mmetsp:Transcript_29239/g.86513  ORF Transcript_29239/g.86513 Transcript_29239/m.86513 type:complete len:239 (-) Transcript_29239:311-1027(-)|eukprot:366355-Chlamydomonas_euryale.AAC.15